MHVRFSRLAIRGGATETITRMRSLLSALALASLAAPCLAQVSTASDGYRVCAPEQTAQGRAIVRQACGDLVPPEAPAPYFTSLDALESARAVREAYVARITAYTACVSDFIETHHQPGAPATSLAPDQAACAHSWAEDEATQAVREFGRACIDFSNRTVMDSRLTPWSGECYPAMPGNSG